MPVSCGRRVRGEAVYIDHSTARARLAAQKLVGAGRLLASDIAQPTSPADGRSDEEGELEVKI